MYYLYSEIGILTRRGVNPEEFKRELDWREIDEYFKDNYTEGKRYEIPELPVQFTEMSEPWIEWMNDRGDSLGIPVRTPPKDLKGDLRNIIRAEHDYVWKVFLQRRLEEMMNGKRSVRILHESQRQADQKEYEEKMTHLRGELAFSIERATEEIGKGTDERIVKFANRSEPPTLDLKVSEMMKIFQEADKKDWGFYQSIANKCILILFQESRVIIRENIGKDEKEGKFSKKCNKCNKYFTEKGLSSHKPYCEKGEEHKWIEISLLERDFYVGLSEFIYRKMENNESHELLDSRVKKWPGRRLPTLRRASRIFSLFVLSSLAMDGWIERRTGTFDDMLLHHDDDDDDVTRKSKAMHPNMIHFSKTLRDEIGKCEVRDFEEKTQHGIFRVLELHRRRWMNCLPEKHLMKKHEGDGSEPFNHDGGYLASRPGSSLRTSVLGERIGGEQRVVRAKPSDKSLEALNILQGTQWEINLDLLQHIAIVEHADGKRPSKRIKDKEYLIEKIVIRDNFDKAYSAKDGGSSAREAELRLNHVKKIIDNLANVFWHAWALDWRGRVNAKAPLLSPQGSDIDRALLRFKEWKLIGEDGWKWFRIFLFGFFEGKEYPDFKEAPSKKLTINQRVEWIDKHQEILMSIVGKWDDPNIRKLLDLDEAPRAKSETFQRLAALIEYRRLLGECKDGDWSKVKSGHPVHFDASSNGLQHLSLLIDSEELAKKVNVIASDKGKQDIYEEVCLIGKQNWEKSKLKNFLYELGLKDVSESIRDLVFTRKMSKQPTMTVFYGARRLDRCFMGRNGKGKPRFLCIKRGCGDPNCEHLFDRKYRLRCWHEKSPLHMAFVEESELSGLIEEGGSLFAEETTSGRKESRQKEFTDHLVNDYKKAIDEATGYAVPELKERLKARIFVNYKSMNMESLKSELKELALDDKGKKEELIKRLEQYDVAHSKDPPTDSEREDTNMLSWTLPDGFEIPYRYNEKVTIDFKGSGLHLHKLIEEVADPSYHHFLKVLNDSKESDIELDNQTIQEAIFNFSGDDEKKAKRLRDKVTEWKVNFLLENHNKPKLKKILKESGQRGFSKLKIRQLAKLIVENELGDVTDWDAIYFNAKQIGKAHNVLRAIYQSIIGKLTESKSDFEKRWAINSSVSITCKFPEFTDGLDTGQMRLAAAANFIHSMDGAHMRAIVRVFDRKFDANKGKHASIWSVHDSFGTHACDIDELLKTIREEMINLHSEGNLGYWIEDSYAEPYPFRSRIASKEIEISQYFVS